MSISGVIYIGVTNNLEIRVWEHKNNFIKGFTEKYKCHKLVYYEHYLSIETAIAREKQLKKWRREKKEFLINKNNSSRKDLRLEWNN